MDQRRGHSAAVVVNGVKIISNLNPYAKEFYPSYLRQRSAGGGSPEITLNRSLDCFNQKKFYELKDELLEQSTSKDSFENNIFSNLTENSSSVNTINENALDVNENQEIDNNVGKDEHDDLIDECIAPDNNDNADNEAKLTDGLMVVQECTDITLDENKLDKRNSSGDVDSCEGIIKKQSEATSESLLSDEEELEKIQEEIEHIIEATSDEVVLESFNDFGNIGEMGDFVKQNVDELDNMKIETDLKFQINFFHESKPDSSEDNDKVLPPPPTNTKEPVSNIKKANSKDGTTKKVPPRISIGVTKKQPTTNTTEITTGKVEVKRVKRISESMHNLTSSTVSKLKPGNTNNSPNKIQSTRPPTVIKNSIRPRISKSQSQQPSSDIKVPFSSNSSIIKGQDMKLNSSAHIPNSKTSTTKPMDSRKKMTRSPGPPKPAARLRQAETTSKAAKWI